MGVSKNRGIPKWMVKIMETPIKMDDLGVPLFSEISIHVTHGDPCMVSLYLHEWLIFMVNM